MLRAQVEEGDNVVECGMDRHLERGEAERPKEIFGIVELQVL